MSNENTVDVIPQPTKAERDAYFLRENEIDLVAVLETLEELALTEEGHLTECGEKLVAAGLKALAVAAHANASEKGWYETDRNFPEEVALIHSEASEALEEYREGRGSDEHYYAVKDSDNPGLIWRNFQPVPTDRAEWEALGINAKPLGIPSELGDVIIRVADIAGNPDRPVDIARGVIEKYRYNRTRPVRHGGKKA